MVVELDVPARMARGVRTAWRPVRPPYGPPQQSAAGRRAAAAALAAAGAAERDVPRAPDGRPCFPRGFPGSIAHTERLAVAVVAPGAAGVGVDVESADIGPRTAGFVLSGRERGALLPPAGACTPRELFAAKEAAFKALYTIARLQDFVFWRTELVAADDALSATCRGESVPVRVRSAAGLSFAVAIRG
ncbi:4'-phosphopantetheinyl transferase superfamily protein [Streptomyces sp. NPDC048172]|uniref:4'-phosphopantetheinyl transferase superfamily protein n=1 Tax=Streptomyces sp. NPDC048172 TaxID=3365505 RepID=UPI003722EA99